MTTENALQTELFGAEIPELGVERDLLTQLEQYRITCAAQQQAIERLRTVMMDGTKSAEPAQPTPEQIEKADAAIREALGDAYDCMRVWSAWGIGTMGPGDFWLVADSDERVAEIRNAAAAALGFEVGK